MKNLITVLLLVCLLACKNTPSEKSSTTEGKSLELKYAEGFAVTEFEDYKLLEIKQPWPNSDASFSFKLSNTPKKGVIQTPISKIVVTSTTHIPALELLGVEQSLVGFPGCDYISSDKTRALIASGAVRELGKNEGLNTEVLIEIQPDLVVGFGVDGVNKTFETIKNSGIPVMYNGDWVEKSPLAKAEWIKFFGVLFNKSKTADSIFNTIETNYLNAKKLALKVKHKPSILSGAMHKDVWYTPNGSSPEGQFLEDANVNYLWKDTSGPGSLALSFEVVFEKGRNADIWLSPSYYSSYKALEEANAHYSAFDAFENKTIYTFSNTKGKTGGVLYYELGLARPDLILKDIIKICHPDVLPNYTTTFFKPLL